jgi:hypothetical protein
MSVFTRSAARIAPKGARWAAVPAAAALAVVAAAGPALAAGTSLGIHTYGTVHAGHLSVSGLYQCASSAPYAELRVTAGQAGPHGRMIESSTVQRVACTGATLSFGATLAPRERHAWFTTGGTRVTATLWTPGDERGAAAASIVLDPSAS